MCFFHKLTINNALLLATSLMVVSFYCSNAVFAEEVFSGVANTDLKLPSPAIHDSFALDADAISSNSSQFSYFMLTIMFLGCGLVAWVGCSSVFLIEKSAIVVSSNGKRKNLNKSGLILGLWPFRTIKLRRSTPKLIYFESSKMPFPTSLPGMKFAGTLWVELGSHKVRTESIENILRLTLLSVPLKNFLPQLCAETPENFENVNLENCLREKFNELCRPMGVSAKSFSFIFIEDEFEMETVFASVMDSERRKGSRPKVMLKSMNSSDYKTFSII